MALASPDGSAMEVLRAISEDLFDALLTEELVKRLADHQSVSVFEIVNILIDKIG